MTIEVCTVFTAQRDHPKWRDDFFDLLSAQRHSATRLGHSHRIVTDAPIAGFDCQVVDLGRDLMRAMIIGVVKRLEQPTDKHIVFCDADVLINRPLGIVFRKRVGFDLALTIRANEAAPVINGVMFVRRVGIARALMFFHAALELCKPHWGGDQEAIGQAAMPVPAEQGVGTRQGCEIAFLSAKHYAPTPKAGGVFHEGAATVHFKGATKDWMLDYARAYQGYAETRDGKSVSVTG